MAENSHIIELELDSYDRSFYEEECLLEPLQALMRCLDQCGQVDIKRICRLTGLSPKEVTEALGSSIIRNPDGWDGDFTTNFELRDGYISGNLSAKLRIAVKMNEKYNGLFEENIAAIAEALPALGRKSRKLHVSLGAPWVPPHIIDEFIVYLLGNCKAHDSKTVYDSVSGMWEIPYEKLYKNNTFNTNTYGTEAMPAIKIIIKTLNSQTIEIMKPQPTWSKERETIDPEQTELALENQRVINEKFESWVLSDKRRAVELHGVSDSAFGTTVGRRYDGSFLTFPNKNPDITMRENQRRGTARIIFNPNTLLADGVGEGKTYTMIAAGYEIRRMGISVKNMYVVSNAVFAQWEKSFEELYPNNSLLAVSRRNFGKDKRQKTLELIRDGNYDAILITDTCFGMIPMSRKSRIDKLCAERTELVQAMLSDKNILRKRVQKKIDKLSEEITKLREDEELAELLEIDEGICFDQLGVTTLFVDEAHEYKNITVKTRSRAVYGILKKGSKKCDGMLEKVHYTQQHGRGAVFATATPISNSIIDVFVMQTFLQGGELKFLDLASFDNWAATFAKKEEVLEVDVDGSSLRAVTRLSKFCNLPDLSALFTQVANFSFDTDSNEEYRTDTIEIKVPCPLETRIYMRTLAERAEQVRQGLVSRKEDNLLKISSDVHRASLDIRCIEGYTCGYKKTKTYRCAQKVFDIWQKTADEKLTQLIFCDSSTPKKGFNVYDELKYRLTDMGVPSKEIAFIHDAVTASDRNSLFAKVNSGEVRVLIGSTKKLGTGVNVQRLLCAVHHLDVPWKPSDMVQRRGRMDRMGNLCKERKEIFYITEFLDAVSWQILQRKQDFIAQFMTNTLSPEASCDFEEMAFSFAEIKAMAVGDPLVRKRLETQNDLNRMLSLQRGFLEQRRKAKEEYDSLPADIERQRQHVALLSADAAAVAECEPLDKEERRALGEELLEALAGNVMKENDSLFFPFMGLDIILPANMLEEEPRVILSGKKKHIIPMSNSVFGNIKRLENAANGIAERAVKARGVLTDMLIRRSALKRELERPNVYADKVEMLKQALAETDEKIKLKTAANDG